MADQLGEPTAQLDILARLAWVATQRGDYATSLTLGQEGLQIAATANLPLERAAFHRQIGIASEELGDFHAALHHYTKALSYDEANPNQHYLPTDLNNMATMQLTQGNYCQGIALLKRAQSLCAAATHPTVYCRIWPLALSAARSTAPSPSPMANNALSASLHNHHRGDDTL